MIAIPVAVPLAWTTVAVIHLQSVRFCSEIGSDCLRFGKASR
jgi:hypothetical protein